MASESSQGVERSGGNNNPTDNDNTTNDNIVGNDNTTTVTFKERSSLTVPRIDKLDDKNYRRWSTLVQDAFEALGIAYTIQDEAGGSGVVKSTESLTLIDSKPHITHLTKLDAEIKADNAAALYMINLCVVRLTSTLSPTPDRLMGHGGFFRQSIKARGRPI